MDTRLNTSQAAFRDEVRSFIDCRLPLELRNRLRQGLPARKQDIIAWQRILHERGWAAPHWPREYGGADMGQAERLILLDELYRAPAPVPLIFNVSMLGPVLLRFGSESQKRDLLPRLACLDLWFCQGFSEPNSGSDLASLSTAAVREGADYVVDGQKIWSTSAHLADWMFALVRTDKDARKQAGISFLLIDLKSPGVRIRPIFSIDGQHHLNEVFFDSVRVPACNLVSEENHGWDCAKYLLANERTGIAGIGLCRERLNRAVSLATELHRDGRPLLDDPTLRRDIAILDAEIRALESTNWRFLTSTEHAASNPAFASVLKVKGSELQQSISQLLQRVAGPEGLWRLSAEPQSIDDDLAPLTARYLFTRAATIYGGSSEIQKDIIAKGILGYS